jgi:hypothetical protein
LYSADKAIRLIRKRWFGLIPQVSGSDSASDTQHAVAVVRIDTIKRCVRVSLIGKLTFQNIQRYASQLVADARFDPQFSEIVDLRLVTEVTLSPNELLKLADGVDPFAPTAKRAFVAHSLEHARAASIHRMLRPDNRNIRIVFSLDEAEQWTKASDFDQ